MSEQLETALSASRPIPASPREERAALEVELLLTENQRQTEDDDLDEFLAELRTIKENHRS